MGKGALIGVIALSFLAILSLVNTQSISRDTADKQLEFQTGYMAKELAMKGRKLVIASWIENGGVNAADFGTLNQDGGTITILGGADRDLSGSGDNEIGFTVRGVYDGSVHDVTSRLRWTGGSLVTSPMQLKVPDLDMEISSSATLIMSDIALDTQSLDDLEDILVSDLGLIPSLGSIGLGATALETEITSELSNAGFPADEPGVVVIDQTMRDDFDQEQEGMYYPDQVIQMINDYVHTHPGSQTTLTDASGLPSTFGDSGPNVLRVENNVSLSNDLTGQGVLIIEGDFQVPPGVSFSWTGLVLVVPPAGQLSGLIDLSGNVNINGSLVVSQEGMPNTGHMDLTINWDPYSNWLTPYGVDGTFDTPWWKHTHDFSGLNGTQVGFTSTHPGFTIHSAETKFGDFLSFLPSSDSLIFELYNPQNHGLSTLTFDITGVGTITSRVAAGFDDTIKSATDDYETSPIRVSDIQHLDVSVNRLSALRKMWDDGNPYPGCFAYDSSSGPDCVGSMYPGRNNALVMRIHKWNGFSKSHVYDASLYWHRRQDEEEDFENEMDALVDEIKSSNYGMEIKIGPQTTLTVDQSAINLMGTFTGTPLGGGVANLGTWHRHWEPDDENNPLYQVSTSTD